MHCPIAEEAVIDMYVASIVYICLTNKYVKLSELCCMFYLAAWEWSLGCVISQQLEATADGEATVFRRLRTTYSIQRGPRTLSTILAIIRCGAEAVGWFATLHVSPRDDHCMLNFKVI